jgi:hypothetical protein
MGTDDGASATDRSHKNNGLATKHEETSVIPLPVGQGAAHPVQNASAGNGNATGGAQIIAFQRNAGKS